MAVIYSGNRIWDQIMGLKIISIMIGESVPNDCLAMCWRKISTHSTQFRNSNRYSQIPSGKPHLNHYNNHDSRYSI